VAQDVVAERLNVLSISELIEHFSCFYGERVNRSHKKTGIMDAGSSLC
jgi:hypothetical protein